MSAKARTVFTCQTCAATSPRWLGRCPSCGTWNSLVEELVRPGTGSGGPGARRRGGVAQARGGTSPPPAPRDAGLAAARGVVSLGEVPSDDAARIPTGIAEVDRVLGGGFVPGGVVLLGGEPGVGKSTLVLQTLAALAVAGRRVLYATGEESAAQVALRGRRLAASGVDAVQVLATTELEEVLDAHEAVRPDVFVVDSIQTVRTAELESAPGSVGQVREVANRLVDVAKARASALLLIGHVTKEGAFAGPKVLEHLVDTVLSFEGDRTLAHRTVRAVKNRFGAAQEVGVFEMAREGLVEVPDPSALFLAERASQAPGSVIVPVAEGNRPLLVEVQALVAPAAYGNARRVAAGVEGNRLAILLAVLDRRAGVHVLDRDVFASVVGGLRVEERAADLGLAMAVVSSLRDRPAPAELAIFGEVGLTGEVRAVPRAAARLAEARKMGFQQVALPAANLRRLTAEDRTGLRLIGVDRLADALDLLEG